MSTFGADSVSHSAFGSDRTGYLATVFVVILNWNGRDDTLACLDSLAALTYPNFNVIVVKNGSTDVSLARALKPKRLAAHMRLRMCLKSYYYKHLEWRIST